jgi:hypothetical protein
MLTFVRDHVLYELALDQIQAVKENVNITLFITWSACNFMEMEISI